MSSEPPPFQEAPRCDVCKCSFNTFRRRLFDLSIDAKDEVSDSFNCEFGVILNLINTIADVVEGHYAMNIHLIKCLYRNLAYFRLFEFVQIVSITLQGKCLLIDYPFTYLNIIVRKRRGKGYSLDMYWILGVGGSAKADPQPPLGGVGSATDEVARLNINADVGSQTEATAKQQPVVSIPECKCGMPLCICESPAPKTDAVPLTMKNPTSSVASSNPKPKKTDTVPKSRGSTSNSKSSSVFNPGLVTNGTAADKSQTDYDVNGEGLREAIKNGDTAAVKRLLSEGVDANYRDKQGLSVLHLAALFNRTDIVFALMDYGASMDYKNAQGN
ncbi:hypothetical protein Gohar_008009 [Gossypium harknessii]|uniref:Uncharacterized protein n=1 Tax=Gossypium harknessii TaxID=34285 RepID=A0A7J9GJJ8_9ROSI|nr:hypothetical protein [Gossypium harknessii]